MRIDPRAPDRAPQAPTAASPTPDPQPCYIVPAPLMDVLNEQLEYLASHVSHACPPGCSDCARLSQVTNWLLLPFRAAKPTRAIPRRSP